MKRVPKKSRIPLAENSYPKLLFVKPRQTSLCGAYCTPLQAVCFGQKPPLGGKRQRSSLSAIINKRIRDGVYFPHAIVIEKNPKRDKKPQQNSELHRRLRFICTKLEESNGKAGTRMVIGDDKIPDITVDRQLRGGQVETSAERILLCSGPTDVDCFSTRESSSTRL